MSSKKAAKAAKAAKRSSKLVDAAQVGDVETMARVMGSGGKLDLDALVVREGWVNVETKEAVPDVHVTALHVAVTCKNSARCTRRCGRSGISAASGRTSCP